MDVRTMSAPQQWNGLQMRTVLRSLKQASVEVECVSSVDGVYTHMSVHVHAHGYLFTTRAYPDACVGIYIFCTHMCVCTWVHVHIHTRAYVCTHMCLVRLNEHACTGVCTHAHVYTCMDRCVYALHYVCMSTNGHVCLPKGILVCVNVHSCIHVCTYVPLCMSMHAYCICTVCMCVCVAHMYAHTHKCTYT